MTITYSFYTPTKHLVGIQQIVKKYDLRFVNNPAKHVDEINRLYGQHKEMLFVMIEGIDTDDMPAAMNEIDAIIKVVKPTAIPKKSWFSAFCKFFIDLIK